MPFHRHTESIGGWGPTYPSFDVALIRTGLKSSDGASIIPLVEQTERFRVPFVGTQPYNYKSILEISPNIQ